MRLHSFFCCLVAICAVSGGALRVQAQDEVTSKDLEIPGVETEAKGDDLGVPAEKRGGARDEKSLFELIKTGGWAMWPLGFFSALMIALMVFNMINLRKANFAPETLEISVRSSFDRLDLDGAAGQASAGSTCLGHIVLSGVRQIGDRGYGVIDTERFEDHLMDASRAFNRGRAKVVNYFSVLAQAAPMLGLLGTVSGMIKAFSGLGRQGMSRPDELASNISEALVTTAAGLLIALPSLFLYFLFRDKLQQLVALSDERGSLLFEHLRRVVVVAGSQQGQQQAAAAAAPVQRAAAPPQHAAAVQAQPPQPPGQAAAAGAGMGARTVKLPPTTKKGADLRPAMRKPKP